LGRWIERERWKIETMTSFLGEEKPRIRFLLHCFIVVAVVDDDAVQPKVDFKGAIVEIVIDYTWTLT
jgi:hypothetical protein